MSTKAIAKSYSHLVTQIKSTIATGQKQIELTKAVTYWKIGEHIAKHLLQNNSRAGYGDGLYPKLSKDLNIAENTLQQAVRFHREFPIPHARAELDWTHYRKLITIDDATLRRRLLKKAERDHLSTRQLAREIQKTHPMQQTQQTQSTQQTQQTQLTQQTQQTQQTLKPLNPQILISANNPLYTYQLIPADPLPVRKGNILIDQGFDCWSTVQRAEIKSAKLVKTRGEMAFTYKAYVQDIIDGDTFWVVIDLGLGRYTRQKLRLRGVDAPEIKTAAGKKARSFVQQELTGLDSILIRSSKSDKYDRYLADVFYGKNNNFLNQALIDAGFAVLWR